MPLASQSPYPIIVYSVANYGPHLSHFWANMSFSRSQLSHLIFTYVPYKRTLTFHLQHRLFGTFANCKYEELPQNSEMYHPILLTLLKMRPHDSQSSRENATPSSGTSPVASYKEVPPPPPGAAKLVIWTRPSQVERAITGAIIRTIIITFNDIYGCVATLTKFLTNQASFEFGARVFYLLCCKFTSSLWIKCFNNFIEELYLILSARMPSGFR